MATRAHHPVKCLAYSEVFDISIVHPRTMWGRKSSKGLCRNGTLFSIFSRSLTTLHCYFHLTFLIQVICILAAPDRVWIAFRQRTVRIRLFISVPYIYICLLFVYYYDHSYVTNLFITSEQTVELIKRFLGANVSPAVLLSSRKFQR